jgi:hypothetical protein
MRDSVAQRFATIVLLLAIACGEGEADRANREALAPLVHRDRALSQEFSSWFLNNEVVGSVSWQDVFDRYDHTIAAKESVLAEVRRIVPTARYDCAIGLLGRSIQADVDLLAARRSYYQQTLRARVATKQAQDELREAREATYGGELYLGVARKSTQLAQEAIDQASEFKRAANSNGIRAARTADSLVASVLAVKLLPTMELPGYPIITDSGPDSLYSVRTSGLAVSCQP